MKHYFQVLLKILKDSLDSKYFIPFVILSTFIITILKLVLKDLCWFGLFSVDRCSIIHTYPQAGHYEVSLFYTYVILVVFFLVYTVISAFFSKNNKERVLFFSTNTRIIALLLIPIFSFFLNLSVVKYFYVPVRNQVTEQVMIDCCKGALTDSLKEVMAIDRRQPFCHTQRHIYLLEKKCTFKFRR